MGVEVRTTTTMLTAFRTPVSPNRIPPPVVIAAQVAAIGRLGCNWRRLGEEWCLSLRFVTCCPSSFLAGLRVGRLIDVKWRAVVHDATAPLDGQQVPGEQADLVDCGSAWVSKS
jgi:hypothetical protein